MDVATTEIPKGGDATVLSFRGPAPYNAQTMSPMAATEVSDTDTRVDGSGVPVFVGISDLFKMDYDTKS